LGFGPKPPNPNPQSPIPQSPNLNLWKKKIKNNIFNSLLNNLEKIN